MEPFGLIKVWEKNLIDLDAPNILMTSSDPGSIDDGTPYLPFLRNRNNWSIWASSGGIGEAEITVTLNGLTSLDSIMMVDHNFKKFTLSYEDSDGSEHILKQINNNFKLDHAFDFTKIQAKKIFIKEIEQISGDSKRMAQLILTRKIGETGELPGKPKIKAIRIDRGKKFSRLLSGKSKKIESRGAFFAQIELLFLNRVEDIQLIQRIKEFSEGFLIHMNFEMKNEFFNEVECFRPYDYFLVSFRKDLNNVPLKSIEKGISLILEVVEVV